MATDLQTKAIDKIVEKRRKGEKVAISKVMEEVGYSKNTAVHPKNLTESDGYNEKLAEYGLTPGLIVTALVEDIKAKKGNRLGEMRLGAEILDMNDDEKKEALQKPVVVAVQIIVNGNNAQGRTDA